MKSKRIIISLGKNPLKLQDLLAVSEKRAKVRFDPQAKSRALKSYRYLQSELRKGHAIYGVNTGFGLLSHVRVSDAELGQLQVNLLRSHAVGTGEPIDDRATRAMLLLRANTLAQGFSGVRPLVIEQVLDLLNADVLPVIPEQGSVGASGDLAPLAHLALVLIGEGRAKYKGKILSGRQALKRARLKPIVLGPKEGLALINGTQFMAALGALALLDAERIVDLADLAGALSLEAFRGTTTAFSPEIHRVRPHPGQITSAARVLKALTTGGNSSIARSHENCGKVQDPYSFRCIPQVHGASRDVFSFVRGVIEREMNAVTDNPLVFAAEQKILSGGNFHGQILAIALDALAIAVAELASISEERIAKLVNPALSDLPAFLTRKSGLNSGFMIIQVAAASLVSENKTLCHPASVDSIPTSADKEDHVSMGAWAARKAHLVLRNTRRVIAMELLSGAQGIDLLRPLRTTAPLEALHRRIREHSAELKSDRDLSEDLSSLERAILNGVLSES
jgi:histidine ammonia-lyase